MTSSGPANEHEQALDNAAAADVAAQANPDNEHDTGSGVPWWILAIGLAVLVGAVFIGVRVGGVLVGLLFPPEPPKPANVEQITYTREMHGVDQWQYHRNPAATCDTITFYQEHGTCEVMPGYCTGEADEEAQRTSALAATCTGETAFSNFIMGWEVEIEDYDFYTRLYVSRDIPWTRTPQDAPTE